MPTGVTRKSLKFIKDETEYYQYQADGIRQGARMSSLLLADEPGLGKTLQALTIAAIDFQLGYAERVLVVGLATLKWNWADEIEKHTNFVYLILDGTPTERERQLELFEVAGAHILLVNYEQVALHLGQLNKLKFDIIIYDEAHMMKNHKSKRTQNCLRLNAKRHLLLTGTPMLNQVNELWPILHRINPQKFPHYYPFQNRYCAFGGYRNKQIIGVKNKQELYSHLQDVMIRRLKRNVLDLPEKQFIPIQIDLSPLQRKLYNSAWDDLEIELPDNPSPMELENALVKYLKLKQICGTTACIPGYEDDSAKLDEAVRLLLEFTHDEPDSPSEPVVVFTQFRDVATCLNKRLEKVNIKAFEINGDVPKNLRQKIISQWSIYQNPTTKRRGVLIMILHSNITVGINAVAANKCIFIDKLYVPKLNEQAIDRLDRIGQTKTVQVYEIIARKTIEQRIETILKGKTKLFDSLIEENAWKAALYKALRSADD